VGGVGSGSYSRWKSKRPVAEDCCFLDINYLNRKGYLRPGRVSTQRWTYGGQAAGSVQLIAHENSVELDYRHTYAGKSEHVHYTVQLAYTACNYGGRRPWFLCPAQGCGRRVGKLYSAGKYFLCRHCYDLAYRSQNISEGDRLLRKAQAIRERLGASLCVWDPIFSKPKGMHWKTFERLRDEAMADGTRSAYLMVERLDSQLNALTDRLGSAEGPRDRPGE